MQGHRLNNECELIKIPGDVDLVGRQTGFDSTLQGLGKIVDHVGQEVVQAEADWPVEAGGIVDRAQLDLIVSEVNPLKLTENFVNEIWERLFKWIAGAE